MFGPRSLSSTARLLCRYHDATGHILQLLEKATLKLVSMATMYGLLKGGKTYGVSTGLISCPSESMRASTASPTLSS